MGGTSSYATHDAALKALGKEEYRALLEATLAWHIGQESATAAEDSERTDYLRGEINGLCMALRLLGGYEGMAFYAEWALTVPAVSFAWRRFLGYRDGEKPAEAVTPTIPAAEKARRYRHKLVDLLEKAEAALRPGSGRGELAALADEAHTVRTQLDVEERYAARQRGSDGEL